MGNPVDPQKWIKLESGWVSLVWCLHVRVWAQRLYRKPGNQTMGTEEVRREVFQNVAFIKFSTKLKKFIQWESKWQEKKIISIAIDLQLASWKPGAALRGRRRNGQENNVMGLEQDISTSLLGILGQVIFLLLCSCIMGCWAASMASTDQPQCRKKMQNRAGSRVPGDLTQNWDVFVFTCTWK